MGLSKPIAEFDTVKTWGEGLRKQWGGDPLAEEPEMVEALRDFCDFAGEDPDSIVEARGWKTIRDEGAVIALVEKVIADNPKVVSEIKEKGLVQKKGFLVGQVMKASQGKADPQEVNRLIDERL